MGFSVFAWAMRQMLGGLTKKPCNLTINTTQHGHILKGDTRFQRIIFSTLPETNIAMENPPF